MKKITLLSSLILIVLFSSHAQTGNVKLYGFIQQVRSGIAPKRDLRENGTTVDKNQDNTMYNYFIYLSLPSRTSVSPVSARIKGILYNVKAETVKQTPVTTTNYNIPGQPETVILVPKTTQKVLLLSPTEVITSPKARAGTNDDLVVSYKKNEKLYTVSIRKFIELRPENRQ
jgi:hypothetical protein